MNNAVEATRSQDRMRGAWPGVLGFQKPTGRTAMVNRAYDEHFRAHVQPVLYRRISREAARLAGRGLPIGAGDFTEAVGRVMRLAVSRGAASLSGDGFADLYDWVISDLADALQRRVG